MATDISNHEPLLAIYALCGRGDTERALDRILDLIDEYIAARDLEGCNGLLASVDIARLDVPSILGFLPTTHVIAGQLPNRPMLYQAAHDQILREHPLDLERLLLRFR